MRHAVIKTTPCQTCGTPTSMLGTCKCDPCWEVERRLENYLATRNGQARAAEILRRLGYRVVLLEQDVENRGEDTEAREAGLYNH